MSVIQKPIPIIGNKLIIKQLLISRCLIQFPERWIVLIVKEVANAHGVQVEVNIGLVILVRWAIVKSVTEEVYVPLAMVMDIITIDEIYLNVVYKSKSSGTKI